MIEFTILLDDADLEFEPASSGPDLSFVLPPTARIGNPNDQADPANPRDPALHLAPIPVHCFLNAIYFGHWLADQYGLSQTDSFVTYTIHDMFKSLLRLVDGQNRGRPKWHHQKSAFFAPIEAQIQASGILDDFQTSFEIATWHNQWLKGALKYKWGKKVLWKETVDHERDLTTSTAGTLPLLGLTIRLQSALSNALSIAYVKRLFVQSYIEAIRAEYPDIFARYDAVSYQYEFVDPRNLTGDADKDTEALCRQSQVNLNGRHLEIRSFVGAYGPHWQPGQKTKVKLPFWLLLTLHEDPVSILFPVPTLYGSDGKPADNPAFVNRVRNAFLTKIRDLLERTRVTSGKQPKWNTRIDEIMAGMDDTFHIVHTTALDDATGARRLDVALATETCSMCGSPVPASFVCSPQSDLGANVSNYTDWHLGDADRACVLCAISHFKAPDALEPARKLIFQRKAIYFSTSTPSAQKVPDMAQADTPFFKASDFTPKLEIRSLESLVTLNIVSALYLHNTLQQAVHHHNGEPDLWLEATLSTDPFSFVGQIAKAKSKSGMPSFLVTLFENLNRPVILLDPLIPMKVEVPFHVLACLWGVSKGRHFQFKYKPLIVSNETGTLPIIWEGYHFVDRQTLSAIERLQAFVEAFKHPKVSHRMKLTALASGPEEFIEILIQLGGFGYGTILERLAQLSGSLDAMTYLQQMRKLIVQTPLITEIWG
jgi:hypothetical protein